MSLGDNLFPHRLAADEFARAKVACVRPPFALQLPGDFDIRVIDRSERKTRPERGQAAPRRIHQRGAGALPPYASRTVQQPKFVSTHFRGDRFFREFAAGQLK